MTEGTERKTKRIIVVEEKHGTHYLEASTDEMWAKSALALLTTRFRAGYWYYDPFEDSNEYSVKSRAKRDALLGMKEEVVLVLPITEQEEMRKKIKDAQADLKEDERTRDEYMEIKRAVEAQDLSWWGKGRMARPVVWDLLTARSDHEYERVGLETVKEVAEEEVTL
jgi:hypothetical protein